MGQKQTIRLCQRFDPAGPEGSVELCRSLAEEALRIGEPLVAFDVVKLGLVAWPNDLGLQQLQALALARAGSAEAARRILEKLRAQGQTDAQTLNLLARVCKDLAGETANIQRRAELLALSAHQYAESFGLYPSAWSAINAATLFSCLGAVERAHEFAIEAQKIRTAELAGNDSADRYWAIADLGESSLILGRTDDAANYYRQAAVLARHRPGDLASSRRNAQLLCDGLGLDGNLVRQWLPPPKVVLFAGHMIDRADRKVPRFPAYLEADVAAAIRKALDEVDATIGFSSAACGADLLFIEAMHDRGGHVHVVLPYEPQPFIADSVAIVPDGNWVERFNCAMEDERTDVSLASHGRGIQDSVAFEYCNEFLFGLASLQAARLGAELAPIAVWDGFPGNDDGGTASAVARWRASNCQVTVIDVTRIREQPHAGESPIRLGSAAVASPGPVDGKAAAFAGRMRAILFADVVGFSKLPEDELPLFATRFLQPVADLVERCGTPPLIRNTWGDAFYFVFTSVRDAGCFALDLCELIANTNWIETGFTQHLSLRIGLHYGPVYAFTNPVTGNHDYLGTQISRAARIEPITPHGQVYASEAFAAIAFNGGATEFVCEYVGKIGLAKDYGTYPTYHVRRRHDSNR